jgi:hypothetical protein
MLVGLLFMALAQRVVLKLKEMVMVGGEDEPPLLVDEKWTVPSVKRVLIRAEICCKK